MHSGLSPSLFFFFNFFVYRSVSTYFKYGVIILIYIISSKENRALTPIYIYSREMYYNNYLYSSRKRTIYIYYITSLSDLPFRSTNIYIYVYRYTKTSY